MTGRTPPLWRSLQYVPVIVSKFVDTAHTRGADAIIVDLEDSVPADQKTRARTLVADAVRTVGQAGADVLVRINNDPRLIEDDIRAAVHEGVCALSLPKIESPDDVRRIEEIVTRIEAEKGLARGHTSFLLLIETAEGYFNMAASAKSSPRVVAMSLGAEDFALDVGMASSEETLLVPRQQVAIAAAAAKVAALGIVGLATRFDDPEAYLEMARRSRRFGFVGASCIHPSQIPLLNAAFSPEEDEIREAEAVVAALEAAERDNRGAVALNGRMIDAPVAARARQVIARKAAIDAREQLRKALPAS